MSEDRTFFEETLREELAKTQREFEQLRSSPSGKETCMIPSRPDCIAKRYPRSTMVPENRLDAFSELATMGILVPLEETISQEESVVFIERRLDMNLEAFAAKGGDCFTLLFDIAEKLLHLQKRIDFHGNLKPQNILMGTGGVFLDDPYPGGDPSFWRQDAHFAAPECIVGMPRAASDWWSLGMVLLHVLGKDPFEGIASSVIAFLLLTRPVFVPEDLPPRVRTLLRGLLTRDWTKRWGYEEVMRWIRGEEVTVAVEEEATSPFEPFDFGGISVRTPEEFAHSITCSEELWNRGKEELRRGYLIGWLRSSLGREDLAQDLEVILAQESDDDRALFAAMLRLAQDTPFAFCGRVLAYLSSGDLNPVPLTHLLEGWVNGREHTESTLRIVRGIVEERLFSTYLKARGRREFLPHIQECEECAQQGRSLKEKAIIYCAYLIGHPEQVEKLINQTRAHQAQEWYAQITNIVQSKKSLRSRWNSLFTLLYQLHDQRLIPEVFEEEFLQAQSWLHQNRVTEATFQGLCSLVLRIVAHVTGVEPDEALRPLMDFRFPFHRDVSEDTVDLLEVRIERAPEHTPQGGVRVLADSKTHGRVSIVSQSTVWTHVLSSLTPQDTFAVLSARKGKAARVFYVNDTSTVVLEPQFLLDLSDLAQVLGFQQQRPWMFFVNRILPQERNVKAIYGTLVARLVAASFDSNEPPEVLSRRLCLEDPLKLLLLTSEGKSLPEIRAEITAHFRKVMDFLAAHPYDALLSEENLLSTHLGLTGRADILLRQGNLWKVVEVKTSKSPRGSNPWPEHQAQVLGYHVIARKIGLPLAQETFVLYTSAPSLEEGRKRLLVTGQSGRELLFLRNEVIRLWQRMEERPLETLSALIEEAREDAPQYLANAISHFYITFLGASPLARRYYASMLAFLFREERLARSICLPGHPILPPKEHQEPLTILPDLLWDETRSDPERNLFVFAIDTDTPYHTDFRAGDRVLLVPQEGGTFFLSGYLKNIETTTVTIQATSRRSFLHHLRENRDQHFIMEHDVSNQQASAMRVLSLFLEASSRKQELLLGQRRPQCGTGTVPPLPETLLPEQQDILRRAFLARDYFLIQGPPGTGKTKVILANLVTLFLRATSERLLLLAFTNRAVDEICTALKTCLPGTRFLRLGSTILTDHPDCTPQEVFKDQNLQEMRQTLETMRILVATVDSCTGNWDIVAMFNPTVAIVDEASQLLEPYLVGILSTVRRFILIGDERQLPAVTLQDAKSLRVRDEELQRIGITNFGVSLFERLLRKAQKEGWHDCLGSLKSQGRMHRDIQDLANALSYGGTLCTMWAEQEAPILEYEKASSDPVERLLARSRVLFIPVPASTSTPRVSEAQVKLVVRFIATIERLFKGRKSVGVIAPFRAQVHAIRKALPRDWHAFVQVDTVDRFQGSEKDIIILSLSMSNTRQLHRIQSFPVEPFLEGRSFVDRRLNVAITRAREHLVILGPPEILSRSPQYRELLELVENKGGYIYDIDILTELWRQVTDSART